MRLARKQSITVGILLSLALAIGCDDKLLKVAQAAKDFSTSVKAVQASEIAAHDSKLVDDEAHVDIQRIFIDVANSGKELDNAVNVAHSKPSAVIALRASVDSLDRLLNEGVVKIKDDKTRAEISIAIIGAKGLLNTIESVIGGK